jgi:hypothetical protein
MPAILPGMGVLNAEQIEILFPVGAFFGQRRIAKTAFHPRGNAVLIDVRVIHIVQILVPGNRSAAECFLVDCADEITLFAGF